MLAQKCSKFLNGGFNSIWTMNFQMIKLDLEKAEEPEIKLLTSVGSSKKHASSRKTSTSALLTTPKTLCRSQKTVEKFFKRWKYQNTLPPSCKTYMQVKKQQIESDMEQTSSKLGKEYVKVVYCHPTYLTSMQSTSWEMPGWMKHKLESRLLGEISVTSDMRWHHSYGRKWRTKEPLGESERREWKSWLKTQHSENEDHGIWSHHFFANRWGNNGNWQTLLFGAPRSLQMVIAAKKLKDACSLEGKLWPT